MNDGVEWGGRQGQRECLERLQDNRSRRDSRVVRQAMQLELLARMDMSK